LSFVRASALVKRQSTLAPAAFRSDSIAAHASASECLSPTRSASRFPATLSSSSAMFSHDPCFGVWWISSRSASRLASAGSNAS